MLVDKSILRVYRVSVLFLKFSCNFEIIYKQKVWWGVAERSEVGLFSTFSLHYSLFLQ